ncbi:MAG: NADH-quinone oxidoreductase subunit NuoF [Ruminococcus albus]|jgi:NADH-quinone oxidoreductase subunit F/NADP-reducing hydrogenase subunit HndC|uniref:NADH-quinone oxidoreductase subunit NuoF n=1 Tax=Ruminococcus sp. TaxID=41978 RepID=UPI0025CE9D12|nr:NADH-quinone oxidoreductase subunit NuoF [Ruminococcus sp.]MBE6873164.1 NADH-quinone oxidoreductase subunit NuoF [Ruminococcus albus]MBQ9541098.1 NADH-quinone oxidoreductase subunit NuoF [Ruminococcus sp.]MBR0528883.1 NADH-quinone oxidoreductase subunit NuoF [Ruminococcus sp.]
MTIEELNKIKAAKADIVKVRTIIAEEGEKLAKETGYRKQVLVCGGTGCQSSHSMDVLKALKDELAAQGIADEVLVVRTGCFGLCSLGPIVIVYPEGAFYSQATPEGIKRIVDEHLVKGEICKDLLYKETVHEDGSIISLYETNFYRKQKRIALRNCGVIDPEDIEEYIATEGYQALYKVLDSMTPDEVVKEVLDSGIRGRGGAGFPTGRKWMFTKDAPGDVKYVACNADEGDPGAFMDRSILEGDPHAVIEAMTIASYAVGAHQGYVYVRAEYPVAVHRLQIALDQAREYGLLGKNILGKGHDFDIEIRLGAGAFVCGEETALLTSIEGNRGEPRPRPPFPAVKGLFGKPTLLNNVETYANIAQIIRKGAAWYSAMGTEKSKGTKVFALGGKITNVGLVEIPMGTTLREIIEEIGGGIPEGKAFKAAQTGGPSGGCIPAQHIDTPIDYESLAALGSMMGSGGLIVMDEDNCMVDVSKFYLNFTVDESCGKCTPCRVGTRKLLQLLEKITEGKGEMEDLEKIQDLATHMKSSSLCALGQSAPNPVLSTLQYFGDEYLAHIKDKKCPAGVCKNLLQYEIVADKCKGCTLCARNCPAGAITGTVKNPHVIDTDKCIKCGVCMSNCKFGAIIKK